jgi:malonate-semialdehyde dehydrogenase (acetylating) / methylmalonate-semialdehyde dehydrogenase
MSIAIETRPLRHVVAGLTHAASGDGLANVDPATGETVGTVPLATAADVDAAVAAARAAYATWSERSVLDRLKRLFALHALLDGHREELARAVTRDMGKTLDDARAEVGRGIESVQAACGIGKGLIGDALPNVGRGVDVQLSREPLGVVGIITPFNFPAMIPLWFLPFALVAGNTVVLKPSEADPTPSQLIIDLIHEAQLFDAGAVNLVHGDRTAVEALIDHPGVDAISFVGSARVAHIVAERGAAAGKRVQALGGAKNALVAMPDADPDDMAKGVCSSAFGAAGQRCLAGSVLIAVGSEEERRRTVEAIVEAAGRLEVGAGDDAATDVCPVVSSSAKERIVAGVEQAVAEGAEVRLDGRSHEQSTYLGPTVLDGVDPESAIAREELFGPVLAVVPAATLDEALAWINGGRYGNASVIFTRDGGSARAFARGVHAGMVGVNVGVAAPVAWFPFSGWKDSFDGDLHANGEDALRFYTRAKVVTSRWP